MSINSLKSFLFVSLYFTASAWAMSVGTSFADTGLIVNEAVTKIQLPPEKVEAKNKSKTIAAPTLNPGKVIDDPQFEFLFSPTSSLTDINNEAARSVQLDPYSKLGFANLAIVSLRMALLFSPHDEEYSLLISRARGFVSHLLALDNEGNLSTMIMRYFMATFSNGALPATGDLPPIENSHLWNDEERLSGAVTILTLPMSEALTRAHAIACGPRKNDPIFGFLFSRLMEHFQTNAEDKQLLDSLMKIMPTLNECRSHFLALSHYQSAVMASNYEDAEMHLANFLSSGPIPRSLSLEYNIRRTENLVDKLLEPKKADVLIENIKNLFPESKTDPYPRFALSFYRGQSALGRGMTKKAATHFFFCLGEAQDKKLAFKLISDVYWSQGKKKELLTLSEEISAEDGYDFIYAERGRLLKSLGRPKESKLMLEDAILLNPSEASCWNLLGLVEKDLGLDSLAMSRFAEARRLGMSDSEVGQ